MNFKLRLVLLLFSSVLMLVLATACEPYRSLTFENQTSRSVQADVRVVPLDYSGVPSFTWHADAISIGAGQSQKLVTVVRDERKGSLNHKYAVIVVNDNNEVVFSKVYTWDELHDMNWIVVIKAQQ